MNIEQQWQAAKEEFGKDAFKRFGAAFMGEGVGLANPSCNRDVEIYDCPLRSLPELFAHDVEVYGDKAWMMWLHGEYGEDGEWWDDSDNSQIEESFKDIYEYQQRKNSANLPFDLARAKAGDVVESLWTDGEWGIYPTIIKENCFIEKDKLIHPDYGWIFVHDLRMKYPPRLKK